MTNYYKETLNAAFIFSYEPNGYDEFKYTILNSTLPMRRALGQMPGNVYRDETNDIPF